MKTPPYSHHGLSRRATLAGVLLSGLGFLTLAGPRASAAIAGPKDHVLFVGTDLAVKEGGAFYQVVGATRDALKIEKDHRLENVRLDQGASVRISKGVKLSNLSATIGNLRTDSVDRVAAKAQLAAMRTMMVMTDMASDSEDSLQSGIILADQGTSINPDLTFDPKGTREWIASVRGGARDAYSNGIPDLHRMADEGSTHLRESLARKGEPEVELTFDVSSPEPIEHPYLIVVANYASEAKPDQIARQVSARAFDKIGQHARHVTMSHAASLNGLPFKKFDIALFAGGQEVATNLSEKRMPLTTDEAYQFFFIDYLSAHKGATLPPAPMLMVPRSEFRREAAKADANQPIYATLDQSGKVLAMSADKAGTEKLPAAVESALHNVRFMPALSKGVPVAGKVRVTLAQLAD